MKSVSFLGNLYPILILVLLIVSLINIKKGIVLLNIVAWTAFITVTLKFTFDYPRPLAVDKNLENFGELQTQNDLSDLQPAQLFELFSDNILKTTRSSDIGRYGLPSGHTSIQIAIWIGLAILFRKSWLWILSITFVLLTAISRMYLGVHYPGDIIGGVITGGIMLYVIKLFSDKWVFIEKSRLWFYLLPVIGLILWNEAIWQITMLLGINLITWRFIKMHGYPVLKLEIGKRILSGFCLLLAFFICFFLAKYFTRVIGSALEPLLTFFAGAIAFYLYFILGEKFNFFQLTNDSTDS